MKKIFSLIFLLVTSLYGVETYSKSDRKDAIQSIKDRLEMSKQGKEWLDYIADTLEDIEEFDRVVNNFGFILDSITYNKKSLVFKIILPKNYDTNKVYTKTKSLFLGVSKKYIKDILWKVEKKILIVAFDTLYRDVQFFGISSQIPNKERRFFQLLAKVFKQTKQDIRRL